MSQDTFSRTYAIPVENLGRVRQTIARINKRAAKLGMQPIGLQVSEPKLQRITRVSIQANETVGQEIMANVSDVTVTGEKPVLSGYAFVAKLDFSAGSTPLVLGMEETPAQYRECAPDCDQCKTTRDRNTTFVLREIATDRHLQVGSTCLTDFFNGDDPFAKTACLQVLVEMHDDLTECEEYSRGADAELLPVKAILEAACAEVRIGGYMSKEKAEFQQVISTADAVAEHFSRRRPGAPLPPKIEPADRDKAARVKAWLVSDEMAVERQQSTYLHNLSVLGAGEDIPARRLGILVSAVAAYDYREFRRLEAADTRISAFVGEVDGKIERAVTILGRTLIPGDQYGDKMLYRMRDDDGNHLVWFCSGAEMGEVGERLHVTGTVKEHRVYNEQRQTTLLRVTAAENKLFDAVQEGRPASVIQKLAAQPISIDRLHHIHKLTALMAAARLGRTSSVQALLDAQASPTITDREGYTAAHYAAALGYANTVIALEDAGADLEAVAQDGTTPLSLLEADQTALLDDVRKFRTPEVDTDTRIWQRDAEFAIKGLLPKQETLDWFIEECDRHATEGHGDLRAQLGHNPSQFEVVIDMSSGRPVVLNGRRTIAYAMSEGKKTVTALVGLKRPEPALERGQQFDGAPAPSSDL
ncbi:ankyrin repeat domain-containing protein [Cupriavidus pampae]|uniref:Ankyrin repeat domain-containing protein n=1 Tax=Cupriavidus pampae TaxID=659251 RepID=A0ABM8XVE3_9BURK|nr:ankyrin repeat domain-containing protein [Cupriavidus pampae]CAG9184373.1 hypothetical protein LMG32289_05599 [Cupriavidus pampae]